jgi:hypothetical protein
VARLWFGGREEMGVTKERESCDELKMNMSCDLLRVGSNDLNLSDSDVPIPPLSLPPAVGILASQKTSNRLPQCRNADAGASLGICFFFNFSFLLILLHLGFI